MEKIKRERAIYTAEQKNYAIQNYKELGATKFCRANGVPLQTLNFWIKQKKLGIELTATRSRSKMASDQ